MPFEIVACIVYGVVCSGIAAAACASLCCIYYSPQIIGVLCLLIMGNKNLYKLLGQDNIQPLIEAIYKIAKNYENPNGSEKKLGETYIKSVVKALEKSYDRSNFSGKITILSFLRKYLLEKDEEEKISIKDKIIKEMKEYAKKGHYLERKIIGVKRIYLFIIILDIDITINIDENYFTIDFMKIKDSNELVHYSLSEFNELFQLNPINNLSDQELTKLENDFKEFIDEYIARFFPKF